MLEAFHLTASVPCRLGDDESEAIRRTLDAACFQTDLRRAVVPVFGRYPAPARVRVAVTR